MTNSEYPARIQFVPKYIYPQQMAEELTIDYGLKIIMFTAIDKYNHTSHTVKKYISEGYDELIRLSGLDTLFSWIDSDKKPCAQGYRDGWSLQCYITMRNNGHSLVYGMSGIETDSPFEALLAWLKSYAPEIVPDW